MNKNLEKALFDVEKAKGIIYAIKASYFDIEVAEEDLEKNDRFQNTFYALEDIVDNLKRDLERLSSDERVADVILAVHKVHKEA